MPARVRLFPVVGALLLGACAAEEAAGPCLHMFEDPVLTVARATYVGADTAFIQVRLKEFEVDGVPVAARELALRTAFNVSVDDATLLCDPPCGFGWNEGTWTFLGRGFTQETTSFRVEAAYEVFRPGCPSSNAVGDSVELVLNAP